MNKLIFAFVLLLLPLCASSQYIPHYRRELRGVWIATVKRLDYPPRFNMSSQQLKKAYVKILDSLEKLHVNAIFFQIRPAADAFFPSKYEPWSQWLTGKQGRPPKPYFDPLKFFIYQAHKHHMQFHAWINPFRAVATISHADIVKWHITRKKPQWFFRYGKNLYFNPGIPQVRNYICKIIADIVRRYNVDGIHFDDYFYPYPIVINHKIVPIPDYETFRKYGKNFKSIAQWRRYNITTFIQQVHDTIKKIKPWVVFGVAPNAIWRNHDRDTAGSFTRGLAAYDYLYADILKWDSLKLLDYVAPELYFRIGNPYADYSTLVKWWATHIHNAMLFIGLNIFGLKYYNSKYWNASQIIKQIRLARHIPKIRGFILYRLKPLLDNPDGIEDSLINTYFADTAIIPLFDYYATHPPAPVRNLQWYENDSSITILWHPILNSQSPTDSIIFYTVSIFKINKLDTIRICSLKTSKFFVKIPFTKKPLISFKRKNKYLIKVYAWNQFYVKSSAQTITLRALYLCKNKHGRKLHLLRIFHHRRYKTNS